MRKLSVIIVAVVQLFFFGEVYSQRIWGAMNAGFNLTQVDGDEVYGFRKAGVILGPSAIIPFGNTWRVSLETLYIQKGARERKQYEFTDSQGITYNGAYKLNLDYVEVPVLIHYNDRDRITAGAGASWGRLVNVREWEHGRRVEATTLTSKTYALNDFSILADIRFRIKDRWHGNFRYAYSMTSIRTRVFYPIPGFPGDPKTRDQFNNVLSFRVIYVFNEKKATTEGSQETK